MKKYLVLLFISFFTSDLIAQSYELYGSDTINRINVKGEKVGLWILLSNNSNGEKIKVSEGNFNQGKKEGKWRDYYANGEKKSIVEYKDGRPNGEVAMFEENGQLKESGTWANNRWNGPYKLYYSTGTIKQNFFFSKEGRRDGKQIYYYPNGKVAIEGNWDEGKENGSVSGYTIDGNICSEKTFNKGVVIEEKLIGKCPEFERVSDSLLIIELAKNSTGLNDFQTLYNSNGQKSKEGFFVNNTLSNGKTYLYDSSGKLMKVVLYKNGMFAGFEINKAPNKEDEQRLRIYEEVKKNEAFFSENLKKREEELLKVKELLNQKNKELEVKQNIIFEKSKEIQIKDEELTARLLQNQLLAKDQYIKELLIKKNQREIDIQKAANEESKVVIGSLYKNKLIKEILLQNQITENEKNAQSLKLAQQQDQLNEAELQRQKIIGNAFFAGFILILCLMLFVYKNYREKNKINNELASKNKLIEEQNSNVIAQKNLIATKNQEITDSINYAQRIQKSLLPPLDEVKRALPDSFILFKPKDIVSGDFYWFSESENKFLIAAADCTGHGVPGAFMSTIGSEKLNEAVKDSDDVSVILNLVNRGMKKVLHQTSQDDSTRDGMDISLCAFNKEMAQVEYAGANRPLWVVKKIDNRNVIESASSQQLATNNYQLIETKATKFAIGGFTEDEQIFTKHTVGLQKGDTIYIFTDGYADQFSPKDKKLMARKFKEIILSIQDKTMKEQKEHLGSFIEDWKGNMEQTDDILVIGVRV